MESSAECAGPVHPGTKQASVYVQCMCGVCACEGGVCECMYVHMYVVVQCTQGNYAAAALCLRVRQLAVAVLGRGDSDEPD
jgi:hypothetical protein